MLPPSLDGSFVEHPGPGRQYQVGTGPCSSYIHVRDHGTYTGTVRVQHDYPGAPFRSIAAFGNWLAIGVSDVAVLVNHDLTDSRLYCLDGYFGSFYPLADRLLVCSASQAIALNPDAQEIWRAEALGLDGVLIHNHDETWAWGTGEMDPPGGWLPFTLNHHTGHRLA